MQKAMHSDPCRIVLKYTASIRSKPPFAWGWQVFAWEAKYLDRVDQTATSILGAKLERHRIVAWRTLSYFQDTRTKELLIFRQETTSMVRKGIGLVGKTKLNTLLPRRTFGNR